MANIAFLDCSNLKVYPGYEGAAAAGGDPRQQQWVPYQVQCPTQKKKKKLIQFLILSTREDTTNCQAKAVPLRDTPTMTIGIVPTRSLRWLTIPFSRTGYYGHPGQEGWHEPLPGAVPR